MRSPALRQAQIRAIGAVAGLVGPDSAWITGQVLRADGGYLP